MFCFSVFRRGLALRRKVVSGRLLVVLVLYIVCVETIPRIFCVDANTHPLHCNSLGSLQNWASRVGCKSFFSLHGVGIQVREERRSSFLWKTNFQLENVSLKARSHHLYTL